MPTAVKRKPARSLLSIRETAYQPDAPLNVDGNRIKDALIVSRESKNRRRYSDRALAQLCEMYTGRFMNLNHPKKSDEWTDVEKRFAWIDGQPRRSAEGVRADVCFNAAHPFAETFKWWAENKPSAIGLSHNAEGYGEPDANGVLQIDEIERVHSVDIVADPATTNGLFESAPIRPTRENHMDPELMPEEGAGAETGGLEQATEDAICHILKDSSLDKKAKLKKIGKALDLLDDEEKEEEEMDLEEDEDEEKKDDGGYDAAGMGKKGDEAMEALRKSDDSHVKTLLEELDRRRVADAALAKRNKARQMCEAAKLPAESITEIFLDSLCAVSETKKIQALIEERRGLAAGKRKPGKQPISAGRTQQEANLESFLEGLAEAQR